MLELYKNIKKLREEKGLSQDALAKLTGYTDRSSIAKIEKGQVDLQQSKIELFAKALGTTSKELVGWDTPLPDCAFRLPDGSLILIEVKGTSGKLEMDLERLVKCFFSLNELGRRKALDNIEDLTKIYFDQSIQGNLSCQTIHSNAPAVAKESAPYLAAAHNDHLDEEGEIDKVKADLQKLKQMKKQS